MPNFLSKTVVPVLTLVLSNLGWAKNSDHRHHSDGFGKPEITLSWMASPQPSLLDFLFGGTSLSFQIQIGSSMPQFNSPPPQSRFSKPSDCAPSCILYPVELDGLPEPEILWTQSTCSSSTAAIEPSKPQQFPKVQKPTPSNTWTATESSALIAQQEVDSLESNVLQCTEKSLILSGKRPHSSLHGNFSCTNRIIFPNQNVYYQGDTMQIWLELPESLKAILNEGAEPSILVMPPEGEAIVIPIELNAADTQYQLIELHNLDTSSFAPGSYQLALVVTEPDGDPRNMNAWNDGFKGFAASARVKIWLGYDYDVEDADGDRFIDGDFDRDGFCEILSSFHLRHGNRFFWSKPACEKNLIVPHQKRYVYYQGDTLKLHLKFPSPLKAVLKGEAEAYVLVAPPEGDIIIMPVSIEDAEGLVPFFELTNLDTSNFALGEYQIALVLTEVTSNDPLNINNLYRGWHGFVSKISIKLSPGCDREDLDGDGQIDGDIDGDGFADEPTATQPESEPPTTEYVVESLPNSFPVDLLEQVGNQPVTIAPPIIEPVEPVVEVEPTVNQPPVVEVEPVPTVNQPVPEPVSENELIEPVVSEPLPEEPFASENESVQSSEEDESLPEPVAREELPTEQIADEPALVEEPEEEPEEFVDEFFDDEESEDEEEDDVEEDEELEDEEKDVEEDDYSDPK